MNEAGCRAISTPPEQILQTKPAIRNRLSLGCACMYCAPASRPAPKIIYRRVARAARGAASDNGAFHDRDRAGSSLSPSPRAVYWVIEVIGAGSVSARA